MRYAIKQCGPVSATVDYLRDLAKTENKVINYCDYRVVDFVYKPCIEKDVEYIVYYLEER